MKNQGSKMATVSIFLSEIIKKDRFFYKKTRAKYNEEIETVVIL